MSINYDLFWNGKKLNSPLSLDCETEKIDEHKKSVFPRFVLGTASDGNTTVVIGPHQINQFVLLHKDCELVGFNWAFDHHVICDVVSQDAVNVLWNSAAENRVHDLMLLDQLIRLAEGKGEAGGDGDGKFFRRDMGAVVKEHLHIEISKKGNEYRLRFAELLDVPLDRWATDVDPGFFEYACKDALYTWELYTVMRPYAESLQKRFGGVAYPDAQKRFGVLTEAIQVKASIALAKITKNGMRVDRERARTLESATRKEFDEFIPYLAQNFPDVLKAYKRKEGYKISKKTGVPQMNAKELQRLFTEWSPSFGLDGPILSKGKERRVSVSTKDWGIFKNKSEFINRWVNAKALSMRLGFFDMLKEEYLHPTYNTMVRTGRVSCTKPNAQQCFDGETEVLTNAGWVRFSDVSKRSDLDSLLVAQWHDGIISFVKPERWVEQVREEPFLRYTNEHIDLCVTEDHLCLLQHRKTGQFKTVLGKDYPEDHRQLHGGLYLGCHEEEFLSDEELILLIATQADGSWSFGSRIDFSFSKERKIDRLKALLDSLGVKYSCKPRPIPNNPNHKRSARIVVSPCELTDKIYSYLGKNKRFGSYLLRLPRRQLDLFCEELFFWDGTWKTKTQYSSVEKENADWAQIALILSNQRANVWEYDGSKWGGKRISHQIARTTRNYSLTTNIERGTLINHDGKSYCVTVPSGYIVVRRKGKTHVTGNCPKKGDFRSCFIASEDHLILKSDYGAIELCTLAAVCQRRFGFSVLGDTIRAGKDPHLYTAALILNASYEELLEELIKEKKKDPPGGPVSDARQGSKALNFGVPGGLGDEKLVDYAFATYGVRMTREKAKQWRLKLIKEVYPELDLYLQSSDLKNLADNLSLPEEALYEYVFENYGDVGMFLHCMGRVIGHDEKKNGPLLKKDGTEFSPSFREKLWHLAEELLEMSFVPAAEKKDLRPNIKDRKGEWKLWKAFFGGVAVTLTGRVRRGVKFTEMCNTQFQGLAADGMKLAIFEMVKRGKRLVATVHDEAVNDVRKEIAEKEREEIGEIMKQCMGEVLDFAVPISVEHKLAECWSK